MLRRAFRWAVVEEVAPADLAQRLNAIEYLRRGEQEVREGRKVRPVATNHIEPILEHLSPQVAAMVHLQQLTGAAPAPEVLDAYDGGAVRTDAVATSRGSATPWSERS